MAGMMNNMGQAGAATGTGPLSSMLSVGGTLLSSFGQVQQGASQAEVGRRSLELANFQADQLRRNAGSAIAASQRSAQDIQRNNDYIASRALAVAASSGGGASDPTVINLIARTAGEGAYRKSLALYQGQDKARALETQADATVYGGEMAMEKGVEVARASNIGATSTLVKGGASLFSKYGMGGPDVKSAAADSSNDWMNA